jgi:hypothetical protein
MFWWGVGRLRPDAPPWWGAGLVGVWQPYAGALPVSGSASSRPVPLNKPHRTCSLVENSVWMQRRAL